MSEKHIPRRRQWPPGVDGAPQAPPWHSGSRSPQAAAPAGRLPVAGGSPQPCGLLNTHPVSEERSKGRPDSVGTPPSASLSPSADVSGLGLGAHCPESLSCVFRPSAVAGALGASAFNCNCLAERCCFNILYRFLCNTLTRRQPEARINSVKGSSFVKSQSCFNDA